MSIRFDIDIDNLGDVRQLYNRIRVYRADPAYGGGYDDEWVELTADDETQATVSIPLNDSVTGLEGLVLRLVVDGMFEHEWEFSEPLYDRLTFVELLSRELTGHANVLYDAVTESVSISSVSYGPLSLLEFGGTALSALGLSETILAGKARWIDIDTHNYRYSFVDPSGSDDHWYKATFYNYSTGLESEASEPRQGTTPDIALVDQTSLCTVDVMDGSGRASCGKEFVFYPHSVVSESGALLADGPLTAQTDGYGHAEIRLLRGVSYTVVLLGTSIKKEFTVPDEETFDLLSALGPIPDYVTVQVPDLRQWIIRSN